MRKILLLTFLIVNIFGYAEVWGEDWKRVGIVEECLLLYDTESITRPSKNTVMVQNKLLYPDLAYSHILIGINCADKTHRILLVADFSKEGNVIDSFKNPISKWDFIIPESVMERLYKKVCKFPIETE